MKRKILCLLLLTASFGAVTAQDQLITVSGDTLSGKIDILMPDDLYEEIMLESNDEKQRYKAFQFVSFQTDGEEYRTIKFGDKYRIMQVEKDGYLNLLRYRTDNSYAFNAQFLYKMDGNGMEVPNFLFKKSISNFVTDCDAVRDKVDDGEFKKKDIEELVDAYNACMANKTKNRMDDYREAEIAKTNSPVIEEVNRVKTEADQMNDQELSAMLDDVTGKLKAGEPIPNYLKNALKEYVGNDHKLKKDVEDLLTKL